MAINRKLMLFLIAFLLPLGVTAYSKYIIPGGETLGIEIQSDGVLVIGFYEINGKLNKSKLRVGDYIKKVNEIEVNSIASLTQAIETNLPHEVEITYSRAGKIGLTKLQLVYQAGVYKTGLYVKDKIIGIGTLSYIDPKTRIYGALGHEIIETASQRKVEIRTGSIFQNKITSINKSKTNLPGSKNAKFYPSNIYGSILKNTQFGIFGTYQEGLPGKTLYEVGEIQDVREGPAQIYTVLNDEEIGTYEIEIIKVNETALTKNIIFEIKDPTLVMQTGGIVQGMSGSPIIQANKIVGAITHVVIDNPLKGYGIFITKMLKEGDQN